MKKLFVINGRPKSGKDTFVNFVSKYAKTKNFSSIDRIKELAFKIGWDGKKDYKGRWLLSELKRILTYYNDTPFKLCCNAIDDFLYSDYEIMFVHIREPEEIEKIVKEYNAETIIVKRNIEEELSNNSDRYVDEYCHYTYQLDNNESLEKLDSKAKSFVDYLRREN